MIHTYDEDLKVNANAGIFESSSRRAEETLGLVPRVKPAHLERCSGGAGR